MWRKKKHISLWLCASFNLITSLCCKRRAISACAVLFMSKRWLIINTTWLQHRPNKDETVCFPPDKTKITPLLLVSAASPLLSRLLLINQLLYFTPVKAHFCQLSSFFSWTKFKCRQRDIRCLLLKLKLCS